MLEDKLDNRSDNSDLDKSKNQEYEKRLDLYARAEAVLREFFDAQTFCFDRCISQQESFYHYFDHEEGSYRPLMGRYGCCYRNFNEPMFERPQKMAEIKKLYLIRQQENSSPGKNGCCSYAGENGCQIRKYRSSICLAFICDQFYAHLKKEHQIDYNFSSVEVKLTKILTGELKDNTAETFIFRIEAAIKRIKDTEINGSKKMWEREMIRVY